MARLNLYLPDDLKARMDAVEANWSSVAQRAFEHELDSIIRRRSAMENAIERLKQEKRMYLSDLDEQGETLGRELGATFSYTELRQISRIEVGDADYMLGEIGRVFELSYKELMEVPFEGYDLEVEHSGFLLGFINGCKEVLKEVDSN